MRLQVDISSDDDEINEAIRSLNELPFPENMDMIGQFLVFVGTMYIRKAAKITGVREHYDTKHMRAKATRERISAEAKTAGVPTEPPV